MISNRSGVVSVSRKCPYCEGAGCEECDGKGRKWRASWLVDGQSVSATGSGYGPSSETVEALTAFTRAASARITSATGDSGADPNPVGGVGTKQ